MCGCYLSKWTDRSLKSLGRLLQDVTSQSLTLPRLNTLQSLSPPKIKGDDNDAKGTKSLWKFQVCVSGAGIVFSFIYIRIHP